MRMLILVKKNYRDGKSKISAEDVLFGETFFFYMNLYGESNPCNDAYLSSINSALSD